MENQKPAEGPLMLGKPSGYTDFQRARDKEMLRVLVSGLILQGLVAQNAYMKASVMVDRTVELTDALFGKLGV